MRGIKLVLILTMGLLMIGCQGARSNGNSVSSAVGCSAHPFLYMNGKRYQWLFDSNPNKYPIKEKIGEVKIKTPPCGLETDENFASNFLEEGTQLYSVKKTTHILLAKNDKQFIVLSLVNDEN